MLLLLHYLTYGGLDLGGQKFVWHFIENKSEQGCITFILVAIQKLLPLRREGEEKRKKSIYVSCLQVFDVIVTE